MESEFTTYKLIVLFMLQHAEMDLTNSQISEFILEKERTNYFRLQQALSELVEAELVSKKTVSNSSFYHLTEDGRTTLSYFGKDLPRDMREDILAYLQKSGFDRPQHQFMTPASFYQTEHVSYAVRCQIVEKNVSILDLTFLAPTQEAAKAICANWPLKSQEIYQKLMEELLL